MDELNYELAFFDDPPFPERTNAMRLWSIANSSEYSDSCDCCEEDTESLSDYNTIAFTAFVPEDTEIYLFLVNAKLDSCVEQNNNYPSCQVHFFSLHCRSILHFKERIFHDSCLQFA